MNRKDIAILKQAGICDEAKGWLKTVKTLREAWETCPRSNWMLYQLRGRGIVGDNEYRTFACVCVRGTPIGDGRTVWDLLTDERSRKGVETMERYIKGEATKEELVAADAAAADAATAAADYDYAAYAAYADSASASASASAAYSASAAKYVFASQAAAAASQAATYVATARKWQADKLREMIPWERIEAALAQGKEGL
jgi:hypothetical protein